MSKKANPTIIGLFVLVGLALGIGALLLVSSSRLFTHTRAYILYFDASLTGLDPGAPVKFRGVTVGAVKDVLVHFNQAPLDASLPVLIEINADLMKKRSDASFDLLDPAQVEAHVIRGLRGRLESQSLLTGLLYVELDFLPRVAAKYHQVKPQHPEIPTAPVDVQLFRVDFGEITQRLNRTLTRLDEGLGELRLRELNMGLTNLLFSLNTLARSPDVTNALVSAHRTLEEMRVLSTQLRTRLETLSTAADSTLGQSRDTLREVRLGVQDVRDILAPDATLRRDLGTTLNDLSEAARSISTLAEFLNRNPNALLTGRKVPAAKP